MVESSKKPRIDIRRKPGYTRHGYDIADYIIGITREIWEERGVGPALERYYADDVLLRSPAGMVKGRQGVVASTLQTLHEFPDRQLLGEDVIWRGDEENGFLSSHRLTSAMTHTGSGSYGQATNRPVRMRVIAECVVRSDQVVEEWLIRDQGAIAACLGIDAEDLARRQVENDLAIHGKVAFFSPDIDVPGNYADVIDDSEEAQAYTGGWQAVWGDKEPALIRQLYQDGACVCAPGGDILHGHIDMDRFVLGYLAAFPDLTFTVDNLVVNRDPGLPTRLAMRWHIEATHSGWGCFGAPGGASVYIMGLTHACMVNGRVDMEWILIDEVSVWKQILAHAGGR
jgi:predicted ester cyclase